MLRNVTSAVAWIGRAASVGFEPALLFAASMVFVADDPALTLGAQPGEAPMRVNSDRTV